MSTKLMRFYLPGKKSQKSFGIFNIDKATGNAQIEFINSNNTQYGNSTIDILFGEDDYENYTFINCYIDQVYIGFRGDKLKVTATRYLKGHKCVPKKNQLFTSISCHITNLNSWAFPGELHYKKKTHPELLFNSGTQRALLKGKVMNIFKYDLTNHNHYAGNDSGVTIDNAICLELRFHKAKTLEETILLLQTFIDFLSIALYNQVECENLRLSALKKGGNAESSMNSYHLFQARQSPASEEQLRDYYLSYELLEPSFDKLINKWFFDRELLDPVYRSTIESLLPREKTAIEHKVVNLASTIENLHRRLYETNRMDPAEFKVNLKKVREATDNEVFRLIMNEKFSHANAPSFRTRINELLEMFPAELKSKIPEFAFQKSFVTAIGDTRNYLVHYDKSYEDKKLLFGLTALFYLHEKLRYILIFNLLKHIGMNSGSQIQAFKSVNFQNLKWTIELDYCVKIYDKVYDKKKK
jgi:hypothetical protein